MGKLLYKRKFTLSDYNYCNNLKMRVRTGVFFLLFISYVSAAAVPANHDYAAILDESRFMFMQNDDGKLELVDLLSQEVMVTATEKDVTYRLYTKNTINNAEIVTKESIANSKHYDPKRKTVFIIHGWRNAYTSNVNVEVKKALLAVHDVNVIVVDWSGPASRNYVTAQGAVTVIGKAVGDFINNMLQKKLTTLSQVTLFGHSLGAHVSGNAGAAVNGKVDSIMGMDPARPLFTYENTANRLDPTDAQFVYIIHTSGGLLGFQKPIGHCDFFPNNGENQPGCGLDLEGTCAHSRSYEYYAESLKSNKFVSHQCSSYSDFKSGKCNGNKKVSMGGFPLDKTLRGSFYLDTNSKPPYAKG